ncbi:fimbria/pilus periplasmic chaperone [Porphyrobacter sp. YT40]|uniref:fimbrial biogenesis chaperone n=1 Tax=Porphyrobacter sp. YT40 TaxID=2547601 RepID=UPI0011448F98|nr:fimbria/pilus periplasmic chaperone [Porphyrobacter sp. YT40]QDH33338.1 molecular chaperone [Porphyrobacter sp. YT40]
MRYLDKTMLGLAALAVPIAMTMAQEQPEDGPLPFDAVPADAASPFGGMALSPTRIILDAGGRGQSVTLYNSGGEPVTYRIDLIEMGLDEAGNYRLLEAGEDAGWSAAPFLRFSPQQVTLQPGERQSVRVIARAPRNLRAGELRSHLRFSSIPLVTDAEEVEEAETTQTSGERRVSVSANLDLRISIPVLLRTGAPQGGQSIRSATRSPDNPEALTVVLERTGQRSQYGILRALDAQGSEVGILRGIAVLPPATTRTVSLPLRPGARPARLVFDQETEGGRTGDRLAEYPLP